MADTIGRPQVWVTTVDNPFDPFTQWDQWYRFDENCGYQTCEHLALLSRVSTKLADAEIEDSIDFAINALCSFYEPNEVYRIVVEGKTQKWGK